ncbi:MAG: tol-pal system protein YbgF [Methylococcales bacterium]|jgi:tol-pal system protein YbgF|nr:tol-pal system protein YbgF [Methylococcales bacterium]MBT7444205.1 tol-pal system protein YbgF [Methylococcales bacterium]
MMTRLALTVLSSGLFASVALADTAVVERRVVPPSSSAGESNTVYVPVAQSASAVKTHQPGSTGGMGVLLGKVNRLQSEVQELRGMVELLTFEIQRIKQNQKDRYLDLDSRITALSSGSSNAVSNGTMTPVTPSGALVDPVAPVVDGAGDPALEQKAYDMAFSLLKKKQYGAAEKAFDGFMLDFPNGRFADNAQYWLGETRYVQNNREEALASFKTLLARFPNSPKVAGAQLKMGYIYAASGEVGKAKTVLNQLLKQHPGSTMARLAKKKLSDLSR